MSSSIRICHVLLQGKTGAPSTATSMSMYSTLIQMLSQGFCHQLTLFLGNLQICKQHEEQLFSEHVKQLHFVLQKHRADMHCLSV